MSDPKHVGSAVGLPEYPFTEAESQAFARHNERERQRAEAEDFEHLKSMAGKAFRGVYGDSSKGAAQNWSGLYGIRQDQVDGLHIQHKPALEALRVVLRKVPERTSG